MSVVPSFDKVNYFLRPKKQIERKILIELLQRIQRYDELDLKKYLYLGMGSIYYYDFILIHKAFGMRKMISLDDKYTPKRFDFNNPYDFIKFINNTTTDFLHDYSFKDRLLIWFDYDSMLYDVDKNEPNGSILEDLSLIVKNSKIGDFLILTIETKPPREDDRERFIEEYEDYISDEYKVKKKYFKPQHFPRLIQNILLNFIDEQEKRRDVKFHKLFSFSYHDTAYMYTLGGVFEEDGSIQHFVGGEQFASFDEEHVMDIDVPTLTYREKLFLDSKIKKLEKLIDQHTIDEILKKRYHEIVSAKSMRKYVQFYKYYPQYYEGII